MSNVTTVCIFELGANEDYIVGMNINVVMSWSSGLYFSFYFEYKKGKDSSKHRNILNL